MVFIVVIVLRLHIVTFSNYTLLQQCYNIQGAVMCKVTTIEDNKKVKGIFLRAPIQKYAIDFFNFDRKYKLSLLEKLVNFKRLKLAKKEDWDGIIINVVVSPIYFTRYQRKATHKFFNHDVLDKIISIGWDPYDDQVGGAAEKEITTFYYKDNTTTKTVNKEEYKFTYNHIIKEKFCKE